MYTKKMVFDYLSGAEIADDLLEKLENDEKFMIEVINHSQDKKLYKYCSDKVKQSPDFVLFLIDTFDSDIDFIIEAVEYCLKNEELDEISRIEIQAKLSNLFDKTKNPKLMQYKMEVRTFAIYKKYEIDYFLSLPENEDLKETQGLGFSFNELDYGGSKLILDVMAKFFLSEHIFTGYMSLEEIIHLTFDKKEELDKVTDFNFLLSYIRRFDSALADYITRNKELVEPLMKEIERVKNNWNSYVNCMNYNGVNSVEDEYEEYIKDKVLLFDARKVMMDLIKKFGLTEIFDQYSTYFSSEDEELDDEEQLEKYMEDYKDYIDQYTMEELLFIKHMSKFIEKAFKLGRKKQDYEEDEQEIEENDSKVIVYDFNTRTIKKGK